MILLEVAVYEEDDAWKNNEGFIMKIILSYWRKNHLSIKLTKYIKGYFIMFNIINTILTKYIFSAIFVGFFSTSLTRFLVATSLILKWIKYRNQSDQFIPFLQLDSLHIHIQRGTCPTGIEYILHIVRRESM